MPNRILKESIRTSKKVNGLSDFQFRVWAYLITYVDDYGRGSADPELLNGICFPRRKGITEAQLKKALADLANTGMIHLYDVDGEPFFCFPNWDKHQQVRAKKSKFPAPDIACNQLISDDCTCPRNPIQSESNPNTNPNTTAPARGEEPAEAAGENGPDAALGRVVTAYTSRMGSFLPSLALSELKAFYAQLGEALCLHGLDRAVSAGRLNWAYIRGILSAYVRQGFTTLAQVLAAEQAHEDEKQRRAGEKQPGRNAPSACKGYAPVDMAELKKKMEQI